MLNKIGSGAQTSATDEKEYTSEELHQMGVQESEHYVLGDVIEKNAVDAAAPAAAGTRKFYHHLAVQWHPVTALYSRGKVVRSSKIRVLVDDINWNYARAESSITRPTGNGAPAPGDWKFAGQSQFGILLYRANGYVQTMHIGRHGADLRYLQMLPT